MLFALSRRNDRKKIISINKPCSFSFLPNKYSVIFKRNIIFITFNHFAKRLQFFNVYEQLYIFRKRLFNSSILTRFKFMQVCQTTQSPRFPRNIFLGTNRKLSRETLSRERILTSRILMFDTPDLHEPPMELFIGHFVLGR